MIQFICPQCKAMATVTDQAAATVFTCACGLRMRVPQPAPHAAVPVSPGPPPLTPGAAKGPELPDEDEAALRKELPADFPPEAAALGRMRFRVERQVLPEGSFKPVFAALLACIPAFICVVAGPLLPILLGVIWILGMVAFSVWFIQWQLRKTKIYAVVCAGGFIQFDGRQFLLWRWADVAAVNMQDIDQRTYVYFIQTERLLTKWYRLRHRNGAVYSFWSTQGPRAAQFGLLVEQETFALMMPAAVAQLHAGGAVGFARFQMKSDGLLYQGHFTPWAEAGPAVIQSGRLRVRGVGPTRSEVAILLEKIDNHHVFLPLLQQKIGLQLGASNASQS
jgi:hypothetical protein